MEETKTVDEVIEPELLEILVCPETKQPLSVAAPELLERVNGAIERGTVANRGGETVMDPLTAGLLREDGEVLYAIRQGIPIMLIDDSIDLSDLAS